MELWLLWIIAGVIFFVIEIFTPLLFFLNLAIASLITAGVAYFEVGVIWQVIIWGVLSALLLIFLRPLLVKSTTQTEEASGIEASYIGKEAKTIQSTDNENGRITIYGEDWIARSVDGNEIPKDTIVKIISYENSIFFVEKI